MACIEDKACRPGHGIDQPPSLGPGQGQGRPASKTDQMLVSPILGEVVHRGTMTEMGVGQELRVLQGLERPIDRGSIETGPGLGAGTIVDVGGGEVLGVGGGDYLADGAACVGYPIALLAQCGDQLVGGDMHRDSVCPTRT